MRELCTFSILINIIQVTYNTFLPTLFRETVFLVPIFNIQHECLGSNVSNVSNEHFRRCNRAKSRRFGRNHIVVLFFQLLFGCDHSQQNSQVANMYISI